MRMALMAAKPAISLSRAMGDSLHPRGGWEMRHPRNDAVLVMCVRAVTLEEYIEIPPSLAGKDGDVSVQAVAGGENQSA